jgi:radical SAM/Cys-rich protein
MPHTPVTGGQLKDFDAALREARQFPLRASGIEVLQLNFGKLCNQACRHCHVEAGPNRKEMISKETLEACLRIVREAGIPTADLTGGAPELNPHFRWFVSECRGADTLVMVRSNLTVILEPGMEDLPEFYRDLQVEVIASLPYYLEKNVNAQRGGGVFEKSIEAMRRLNEVGYGKEGSPLVLNLVYNPGGAFLPPPQASIEADFRKELGRRHSVEFNGLYTITNMPIGRFRGFLERTGNFASYMDRLIQAYNPAAADGVMCRTTLSVSWDGSLYDCDFNQMLDLTCDHGAPKHIREFSVERLTGRRIVTGLHCYGCTAGAGSSCGGALVDEAETESV